MKDIWTYAIERGRAGDTPPEAASRPPSRRRGRVLRVKGGYNPNSSSVGSAIPMFLTLAAGSGALAVVLLNALGVVGKLLRKQPAADRSDAVSAEQAPGAEPAEDDA